MSGGAVDSGVRSGAEGRSGPNMKVLAAGLAVMLPLLIFLAVGFKFDPKSLGSPLNETVAPRFMLKDLDGNTVALGERLDKPVVLNFWATWCGPCKDEHPGLVRLSRELAGRVNFIGVVYQDEEPVIRDFLNSYGTWGPTLLDENGSVSVAYGVSGVPETFVIDTQGVIRKKYTGPVHWVELARSVQEVLGS